MVSKIRWVRASASRVVRPAVGMGSPTMIGERARVEVVGVDGEQLVGSDQGDGHERDLGLDGHVGAAGEEGLGAAVGGAASFGEEDEGQAVLEGVDAAVEAGDRRSGRWTGRPAPGRSG